MSHRGSRGFRPALLVAGALSVCTGEATVVRAAGGYPTDAGTIVVQYREKIGEIGESDTPSLTVYGDGRAVAHWPAYMKRAGDYHVRLSRRELDSLVASLVANGVLDVDPPAVRRAAREAAAGRMAAGAPPITSDPDVTTIELNTDRGQRAVRWAGLRDDARRHPDVPAIQALHAARQELVGVMERAYGAHE